jgi:hypothetical protein
MQTIPRTTITTIQVRADVVIENVITRDCFDGSPMPPEGDGWHLVRRLKDWCHEWRRITLVEGD